MLKDKYIIEFTRFISGTAEVYAGDEQEARRQVILNGFEPVEYNDTIRTVIDSVTECISDEEEEEE